MTSHILPRIWAIAATIRICTYITVAIFAGIATGIETTPSNPVINPEVGLAGATWFWTFCFFIAFGLVWWAEEMINWRWRKMDTDFCYFCEDYTPHENYVCQECELKNYVAKESLPCQCDSCDCAHQTICDEDCDCEICKENNCGND